MRKSNLIWPLVLTVMVMILLSACQPTAVEPTAELVIPTAIAVNGSTDEVIASTPTTELPAPPTFQPVQPADQPAGQPTPQPGPTPQYRVAFVAADDTLNVRSGPGVDNEVVAELDPGAPVDKVTGAGQLVEGSTWVPIQTDHVAGWVNGRYLTASVDSTTFCQEKEVDDLLADLKTAVAEKDGSSLAQLIHPERGLRLHHAWWNPEVLITREEARQIFTSSDSFDWGMQDGSGDPIVGSFSDKILPLLQEDLLAATETACDEILHGSTAGIVRLPDGYDAVHFYSLYRPGTEEFAGMNWGAWVVGIEQWQGDYFISFLVHFQWEI